MDRKEILKQVDQSVTPVSLYTMGMCSDVQELILMGMYKEAISLLNDIKVVIDDRLSEKDEHGRHV